MTGATQRAGIGRNAVQSVRESQPPRRRTQIRHARLTRRKEGKRHWAISGCQSVKMQISWHANIRWQMRECASSACWVLAIISQREEKGKASLSLRPSQINDGTTLLHRCWFWRHVFRERQRRDATLFVWMMAFRIPVLWRLICTVIYTGSFLKQMSPFENLRKLETTVLIHTTGLPYVMQKDHCLGAYDWSMWKGVDETVKTA